MRFKHILMVLRLFWIHGYIEGAMVGGEEDELADYARLREVEQHYLYSLRARSSASYHMRQKAAFPEATGTRRIVNYGSTKYYGYTSL